MTKTPHQNHSLDYSLFKMLLRLNMISDFFVIKHPESSEHCLLLVLSKGFTPQDFIVHLSQLTEITQTQALQFTFVSHIPYDRNGLVQWKLLSHLSFLSLQDLDNINQDNISTILCAKSVTVLQQLSLKSPLLKLDDEIKVPSPFVGGDTVAKIEATQSSSLHELCDSLIQGPAISSEFLNATTLQDCLNRAIDKDKSVTFIDINGRLETMQYAQLQRQARHILAGLQQGGLKKGDFVIFQFSNALSYLQTFWACIYGGFIPAPVAMPQDYEAPGAALEKLLKVHELLGDAYLVTDGYFDLVVFSQAQGWKHHPLNFHELVSCQSQGEIAQLSSTDGALILFTSGSTGVPKGVLLNHQNILLMSAGTIQANQLTSSDVSLNWMPLDHVGAIVFLSCLAVDLGIDQIHVPTDYILEDPLRFLDLIETHKASMSWAPNFAFSLLNNLQQEIEKKHWNLSSMRFLVNAGEQISSKAAREFLHTLSPHKLSGQAIVPAFGMSETCSGISWSLDFSADGGEFKNIVSLGPPIPGAMFRIVDDTGALLPIGSIGHFQIKGGSLFSGYYKRDDLNRQVFVDDGWFDTGDMGFIKEDQLYLTGRNKDDIIINGVNFFSHEIEQTIEELSEVAVSFTAASAVMLVNDEREKLAVFLHPVEGVSVAVLQRKVQAHLLNKLGLVADFVLVLQKVDFPKTGIGKIQKSKLRSQFEKGDYVALLRQQGHGVEFANIIEKQYFTPSWLQKKLIPSQSHVTKRVYMLHFSDNPLKDQSFEQLDLIHCMQGQAFTVLTGQCFKFDFSQQQQWRELFQHGVSQAVTTELVINVDGLSNETLENFLNTLKSSAKLIRNSVQALRFIGYTNKIPSHLLSSDWLAKQQDFVAKGLLQVVQITSPSQFLDVNLAAELEAKVVSPYVIYTQQGRWVMSLQSHQPITASGELFGSAKAVVFAGNDTRLISAFAAYLKTHFNFRLIYCGSADNHQNLNIVCFDAIIENQSQWQNLSGDLTTDTVFFDILGPSTYTCDWHMHLEHSGKVYQVYPYYRLPERLALKQTKMHQLFLDSAFSEDSQLTDIAQLLYFIEQQALLLVSTSLEKASKLDLSTTPPTAAMTIKSYLTASATSASKHQSEVHNILSELGHELVINTEFVEQFPLDYKGRIDRKSLGRGRLSNCPTPLRAAAVAKKVEKVWQAVLNLQKVPHDETFFDLGGHSLLIAKTQGLLETALDRKISILELFKFPTIAEFSRYIQDASELISNSHAYGMSRAKIRNSIHHKIADTDIAIIGMACRYPGANDVESFWQNLSQGKESISFFSEADAKAAGVHADWYSDKQYVFAAPLIDDIDQFDADFFAISGRDAELMDPQQRVAVEVAWETLERAGYNPKTYGGAIGVYSGAGMNTYLLNNIIPNRHKLASKRSLDVYNLDSLDGFQIMITNDKDYISMRISYCLDLKGPSVNVQTACSTSLVAVHMACQSIISGESDMALAGGVSIKVPQKSGYSHAEGMIVAADGHCKAFDEKADGTIFGSGCGFVLLKPLNKALEAGDRIHAVIKGTSFNNDGGQKIGFAAPSEIGESSAIAEAIAMAGVSADTLGYIETHGTGTELGDPIEVSSLTSAFRETTDKKGFCPIGTVKSNVGHLQIASGIVGFMKSALSVENAQVPASLHFETPNPKIPFANSPFYVNTKLSPWSLPGPRRAGVNSLGIGGGNTHAILEEAQCHIHDYNRQTSTESLAVLTISAKNEQALNASVKKYVTYLQNTDNDYRDICYTSNVGRVHFDVRVSVWGSSKAELVSKLQLLGTVKKTAKAKKLAFAFSGQGSQYPQMAKTLYLNNSAFQQDFDMCDTLCQPYLKQSLKYLLLNADKTTLANTLITQPMLFSLEVCLAKYWLRLGLEPHYLIGHSLGEYAAACIAKVFSLEDGLKLVLMRARLMNALPTGGGMLAIDASEVAINAIVDISQVSIAAINGPKSLVLSGELFMLDDIATSLKCFDIRCTMLDVSHAFHSDLLTPMLGEFADVLDEIEFGLPKYELISNVTGKAEVEAFAEPEYWLAHLMEPVQFAVGIKYLQEEGVEALVEIGPQATLLGLAVTNSQQMLLAPSLRKNYDSEEQMLTTLVTLYEAGQTIDFESFHTSHVRSRVVAPTYAFQKNSYWIEAPKAGVTGSEMIDDSPEAKKILGRRVDSLALKSTLYEMNFDANSLPYLQQHKIFDAMVVPGAGHIAMLLQVCQDQFGAGSYSLQDLVFPAVMIVAKNQQKAVQLSLLKSDINSRHFELISELTQPDYKLHCSGKINRSVGSQAEKVDLLALQQRILQPISKDDFYAGFERRHIALGPLFCWVEQLWGSDTEALAKMKIPTPYNANQQWLVHPGLIDSGIQILMGSIDLAFDETLIPFGIDLVEYYLPIGSIDANQDIYSHFQKMDSSVDGMIIGDVCMFNANGEPLLKVVGLKVRRISQDVVSKEIKSQKNIGLYQLETRKMKPVQGYGEPKQQQRVLKVGDCDTVINILYGDVSNQIISSTLPTTQTFDALVYACSTIKNHACLLNEMAALRALFQTLLRHQQFTTNAHILLLNHTDNDAFSAMLNAFARVAQLENPALQIQTMHNPQCADLQPVLSAETLPAKALRWDGVSLAWQVLTHYELDNSEADVFEHSGAFIITGAFGGLGLKTCEILVEQGVKELILLARKQPVGLSLVQIQQWQAQGLTIQILAVDVADRVAMMNLLTPALSRIKGIFHCAGMLQDQLLSESDQAAFEQVYQAKVKGTLVLDELSKQMPELCYFVGYSSVSSVFGAFSQAAYGSANAFMDALMHQRKQAGLPGLSINWGPWADVGMASMLSQSEQAFWHNQGLYFLDTDACKKSLISVLQTSMDTLPAQLVLADINWDLLASTSNNTIFDEIINTKTIEPDVDICRLIEAAELADRFELLGSYIQQQVADVLGRKDHRQIDGSQGLMELGLDSLAAMGLKGRLEAGLKISLKVTIVFDYPTLDSLIEFIGNNVLPYEFTAAEQQSVENDLEAEADEYENIAEALERQLQALELGE